MVVGVGLIVAAIVAIISQREVAERALDSLKEPRLDLVLLLLGGVALNVVLAAVVLHLLMSRYGRIGVVEMQALIAAVTLLNFLPLRPGFAGRMAYHKTVNGIAVRDSIRVSIQAALLGVGVAAYLAVALTIIGATGGSIMLAVVPPAPLLALSALLWRNRPCSLWLVAGAIRFVEVMIWAGRYFAVFALIGSPVRFEAAIAFACLGTIANMVPLVSNGLGLREWGVGLASPWLGGLATAIGLTADLVNRAAELLVALIVGSMGFLVLGMQHQRRRAATRQIAESERR